VLVRSWAEVEMIRRDVSTRSFRHWKAPLGWLWVSRRLHIRGIWMELRGDVWIGGHWMQTEIHERLICQLRLEILAGRRCVGELGRVE
jgi:hypothetical protein